MTAWEIRVGDCRELLRDMPERSVQTCVTSPPYFGLRDYGHDGEEWPAVDYETLGGTVHVEAMRCAFGLEPTPAAFVGHAVLVFREVRRVLRDDGTVWLNLGDSYNAYNGNRQPSTSLDASRDAGGVRPVAPKGAGLVVASLKSKDLLGIPWMVAFALRADGWYLRSDVIWAKPNPMPESVTDRPTKAHEYLFLLSKSARYFYDPDAIRNTAQDWGKRTREGALYDGSAYPDRLNGHTGLTDMGYAERGRNKRSVWTVATQPFAGAHFATFPPKLIEPCILAGSAPKACGECGAPWQRVTERTAMVVDPGPKREAFRAADPRGSRTNIGGSVVQETTSRTVGWAPTCGHDDDTGCSVVLDPFAGSGTVGVVCGWHDREFIGLELNAGYADLARDRITSEGKPWRPKSDPPRVHDDQMGLLG